MREFWRLFFVSFVLSILIAGMLAAVAIWFLI